MRQPRADERKGKSIPQFLDHMHKRAQAREPHGLQFVHDQCDAEAIVAGCLSQRGEHSGEVIVRRRRPATTHASATTEHLQAAPTTEELTHAAGQLGARA